MLEEALRTLQDTAVNAAGLDKKVYVFQVPGEKRKQRRLLQTIKGIDEQVISMDPPDRSASLHSVDQILPFLEFAQERYQYQPTVWVGTESIIVVCDDRIGSHRADKAICGLSYTPEWRLLRQLHTQDFTQKQLVKLLRMELSAAATAESQELLRVARSINSKVFQVTNSASGRQSESIGKSIDAEMQSDAGDFPEVIAFSTNVYDDSALQQRYTVAVDVTLNPQESTVTLTPRVAQMREFEVAEREKIKSLLDGLNCPVFLGTP